MSCEKIDASQCIIQAYGVVLALRRKHKEDHVHDSLKMLLTRSALH